MSDNVISTDSNNPEVFENTDCTGNPTVTDYTQVVSVAQGGEYIPCVERRRQSLRAKLEREQFERDKQVLANSFITTFRNLFSTSRH